MLETYENEAVELCGKKGLTPSIVEIYESQ